MKNEMTPRGWVRKFRLAGSGLWWALTTEGSFRVHLPTAGIAILLAFGLGFELWRWCILVLVIGFVLTAEVFNTAIECLAPAVDDKPNEHIRVALDVASGGVLLASGFAALLGILLFAGPAATLLTRTFP